MSYQNSVTLKVLKGDPWLIADLREVNKEFAYLINDDGTTRNQGNAYEVETDLRSFSAKHPDTLFELYLLYEEPEGSYKLYAQGGKIQKCAILLSYEPFDLTKFK